MSTRQLRLNQPDKIKAKLLELNGQTVNFVLADRTSMIAKVQSTNAADVRAVNMRGKAIAIPFDKISEIYFDTKE